jgi:hypothetical protein
MGRAILAIVVLVGLLAFFAYERARDRNLASAGSASERLQPVTSLPQDATLRRTVYVPVYSSVYLGLDIKKDVVQLASTLSIRNTSAQYPIVLEFVRYYDSAGHLVRDHLAKPAELRPLASVEYVVKQSDTTGGPGANFLVRWSGPSQVDEPLTEAVMIGRSGNAGISFTSVGRTVTNEPPQ